jgi:thiopeptide-type bacteriocin biosynthesis protein
MATQRSFRPGSEWLYAKVYSGKAMVNAVLTEVVAPIVEQTVREGAVDAWHFVRYEDPEWHVRVRFHGEPQRLLADVLPSLSAAVGPVCARGLAWRFQVDSYEREIERYGGPDGIVASEALFFADSEAVLGIVPLLYGDEGKDVAWRVALRGMDQLLDDLGFTLGEKLAIVTRCREGFLKEHTNGGELERQIGARFRRERLALEALLDRSADAESPFAEALACLRQRSQRVQAAVAALTAAEDAGRLTQSRSQLAASYLHMHANRMFASAARAQELVLYDFLERLYQGQQARTRRPPQR